MTNLPLIVFILTLILGCSRQPVQSNSAGQLSEKQQADFAKQCRQATCVDVECRKIQSGFVDEKRLACIRQMLVATHELYIHRQRGGTKNEVFLSPDGHSEAVFDQDKKLVSDGMNDGSYNYAHPESDPICHFVFDIHPWILWGASKKDPTMGNERIFSYVSDLEGGIVAAASYPVTGRVVAAEMRVGEVEGYAVFLRAIDEGNAGELFFNMLCSGHVPESQALVSLLKKLDTGLRRVYGSGPTPQGGANGRQPFNSVTNQASAAAASRRSP